MSITALQINDVARELTDAQTALTQTVTLPAGSNRVLIVPFLSVFNDDAGGPASGAVDDIVATYGGVTMNVKAVELVEQATFGVAAMELEGQSFASETLSISMGVDNKVYLITQAFIYDGVLQGDADFSFASQASGTAAASITLPAVTPDETGDLVFMFGIGKWPSGQLTYSGTDSGSYTLQATSDSGDFVAPDGDDGSKGRTAYSVAVTGAQAATWEQAGSTTIGAVSFVMRAAPLKINCDCSASPQTATLKDLRDRMMIRLGFAAQVDNPPPGMASLLNDFLQAAQKQLYYKYTALRTERFFRWEMVPGERFYGFADDDVGSCSGKDLDPRKLSWVGYYDLNEAWRPLAEGINPLRYTSLANNSGWPDSYEVRQCIEIFPAPQAAYTLVIKGHFGLLPFTGDSHVATIDDELIFLLALANAKSHYQQPDAGNYFSQVTSYLGDLNSGNHGTARYIPGQKAPPSQGQPIFLPTQDS